MLPRFFSEVFHGVWAMHKQSADGYMPLIASILKGDFQKNNLDLSVNGKSSGIQFLNWSTPEDDITSQPVETEVNKNTISILNIIGPIVKYDMACGPIGTDTMEKLLDEADADPNVQGHIIYVDSPGGEGYAAMSLARKIKNLKKPTIGYVSDIAASGGYCVVSATGYIVVNSNIARVGSMGTYVTYRDYHKMLEMNGIVEKDIYATKSTEKNKESREAEKGNFKPLIASIDRFNEEFLSLIKENRGSTLGNESIWNNGKLFFADESFAEKSGLIDDIATFEETFQSFVKTLNQ